MADVLAAVEQAESKGNENLPVDIQEQFEIQ